MLGRLEFSDLSGTERCPSLTQLSRWDVLRIVKAGFKHAFLPKREIGVLLRAVESEVYELVTTPEDVLRNRRPPGPPRDRTVDMRDQTGVPIPVAEPAPAAAPR